MLSKYIIDTAPREVQSRHDPDAIFVVRALDGLTSRLARVDAHEMTQTTGAPLGAAIFYQCFRHGCIEVRNLMKMGDSYKAENGCLPNAVIAMIPTLKPDIQQEIGHIVYTMSTHSDEVGADEGK